MKTNCISNLLEIKTLIIQLRPNDYSRKLDLLSEGTIGQHVRHILEFYQCVKAGVPDGLISYDKRKRDLLLESNVAFAEEIIAELIIWLSRITCECLLYLEANLSNQEGDSLLLPSSLNRELGYCLEHGIHHQALIKVGLAEMHLTHLIDSDFGVAPATLRYRQSIELT